MSHQSSRRQVGPAQRTRHGSTPPIPFLFLQYASRQTLFVLLSPPPLRAIHLAPTDRPSWAAASSCSLQMALTSYSPNTASPFPAASRPTELELESRGRAPHRHGCGRNARGRDHVQEVRSQGPGFGEGEWAQPPVLGHSGRCYAGSVDRIDSAGAQFGSSSATAARLLSFRCVTAREFSLPRVSSALVRLPGVVVVGLALISASNPRPAPRAAPTCLSPADFWSISQIIVPGRFVFDGVELLEICS
jgi:hypothetical protein